MDSIISKIGIPEFLEKHPGMSLRPYLEDKICLQGNFDFKAKYFNITEIEDDYNLQILIPEDFPTQLPSVKELRNKITPELANNHLFRNGSLCLGSPYRIQKILKTNPTINEYTDRCLIPYLYAISIKIRKGGDLIFGGLNHGIEGIAEDYLELKDPKHFKSAVQLIRSKKRVANKKICPCGCGKRLGICTLHYKINELRMLNFIIKR